MALATTPTRYWERDSKPTSKIHHSIWVVLLSQHAQLLEITAVYVLRSRRLHECRINEVWEPFRRRTQCVDLFSQFLQGRFHGADPEFVVVFALPGEVRDDRAVGLVFLVGPCRWRRLVKHGFRKGPQANIDTPAPVFFDILGSFLRHAGM